MADPNNPQKKMKVDELSEEPMEKLISPKKIICHEPNFFLNLNPNALSLQRVKRRNAIILKLSSERVEDPKQLSNLLSQTIGINKSLKTLFLSLPSSFRDQDLRYLAHSLEKLKSLQRITLQNGLLKITDAGLSCMMRGFSRLCSLKSFSFDLLNPEEISDVGLNSTSRSIKKMAFLKQINLLFYHLSQITGKGMCKVNGSLNRLIRLEDVTLANESSPITDESFANFKLKRLISLRKVYFSFGCNDQLTNESIHLVTQGLKDLPKLQSLKLQFPTCPEVCDWGLHYIWETMNSLPSLRRATLDFSECMITDAGFDDMNETLKCLDSIQKLHLDFLNCNEITDDGLAALCEALDKAISLQDLSIYLGGCIDITDIGVKEVIDCMKRLTNLKCVGIDFSCSEEITDTTLNYIRQFLTSQTSLEKIDIYADEMDGTTEEAWNDCFQAIGNLKKERSDLELTYGGQSNDLSMFFPN